MIRHTLAANIKRLRLGADLTQAQLAERAEIGLATLQRIERAEGAASIDKLENLANALNTTPSALLETTMLKPYTIRNVESGHTFGVYHGVDELDAYRALCEDARAERPDEIPSDIDVIEGDPLQWVVEYVTAWADHRGHSPRHEWDLGLRASEDDITMLIRAGECIHSWDQIEAAWEQAGDLLDA